MTERFGSRSAGRWVLVRLSQFLSCLHLFNGDVAAKFPPMSLCAEDKVGLDELPIEASRICPLTHPPSHKHPPPPPRTRTRPILARARTHTHTHTTIPAATTRSINKLHKRSTDFSLPASINKRANTQTCDYNLRQPSSWYEGQASWPR